MLVPIRQISHFIIIIMRVRESTNVLMDAQPSSFSKILSEPVSIMQN